MECGLSKPIERLEMVAGCWFHNSRGEVKIVLVISVSHADKKVNIDQRELYTALNLEVSEGSPLPTITLLAKTGHVEIADGKITGTPLRLDCNKTFLRDPGQGQRPYYFH